MKLKNKKEDFLVCYQVHQVQLYQGINRAGEGAIAKRQGRGIARAGYGNEKCRKATTKNKWDF